MNIKFTLNNRNKNVVAEAGENLQALLQRIGIHSVRNSDDGEGFAGSDTILFDGVARLAGLMIAAQAEGHSIETVESFMQNGKLSALQSALLDAGVVQSAYNTPAAVLVLEALFRRNKQPDMEDVREALSGIFNRATGYVQFYHAVKLVRDKNYSPQYPEFRADLDIVGKSARKVDGVKLVAGMKAYVEDFVDPGTCYLKILRSPHAHAYIEDINTAAAEGLAGVVTTITYKNCPDVYYCQSGQGFPEPTPYDRRMFGRKVRHVGDRVAAVVAESEEIAEEALELIQVKYEMLDPILSLDAAIAAVSTPVHGGETFLATGEPETGAVVGADPREGKILYQFSMGADPKINLAASAADGIGDVEDGFKQADVTIERTYNTSKIQCTPLEPHCVFTKMDGDRLVIHASTQVPWHLRRIVATVLGIRENRIRVIKERIGGGYGSKQDILLEEVCSFATFVTGRPVFYKYTRKEEFIAATTRHPFRITVRLGATRGGKLTAIQTVAEADTGAYGNHCLTVPMNSCSKSIPLFMCDNISFSVKSYYTNLPPSGAYQGYGAPQASFAVQTAAAELADTLGMDYLEFIEINRVREGSVLEILRCLGEGKAGSAVTVRSCGLEQALSEGREMIGWGRREKSESPDVQIGKGVVIVQQGSGLPGLDQACVDVKMLGDGSFMIHSGGADLGTGLDTVLVKMVAETLCTPMDTVAVLTGDTDITPFDTGAYASSGTFFTGNAALLAAKDLLSKILDTAAFILKEDPLDLEIKSPGNILGKKGSLSYAQIAHHTQSGEGSGQLVGYASFTTEDTALPYAAHFCQVAINIRTGELVIQKYYALHDSGTPVNPDLTLGQIYGGILKSIGHSLYEEMLFDDKGRCLTTGLGEYGVPMIQELPEDVQVRLIHTDDPYGPFGGKSVAEISVNGAAPALAIAIHDAAGIWIRSWPFTAEKILRETGKLP